MERKTETRPFIIFLAPFDGAEPELVDTIQVEVYHDEDGDEVLTPESISLIDRVQARHRGLMFGSDIRAMRGRLDLTQKRLASLLGCGEKTLSRLENGEGHPSLLVNRILRLLDEGLVSPASLEAVIGRRRPNASYTPTIPRYDQTAKVPVRNVGARKISKMLLFRIPLDEFLGISVGAVGSSYDEEFFVT